MPVGAVNQNAFINEIGRTTLTQTNQPTRSERETELRHMWRSRQGQYQVLQLFWKLQETGDVQEGESVFDAVLNHEYDAEPDATDS